MKALKDFIDFFVENPLDDEKRAVILRLLDGESLPDVDESVVSEAHNWLSHLVDVLRDAGSQGMPSAQIDTALERFDYIVSIEPRG
jgi:hypothetical protein